MFDQDWTVLDEFAQWNALVDKPLPPPWLTGATPNGLERFLEVLSHPTTLQKPFQVAEFLKHPVNRRSIMTLLVTPQWNDALSSRPKYQSLAAEAIVLSTFEVTQAYVMDDSAMTDLFSIFRAEPRTIDEPTMMRFAHVASTFAARHPIELIAYMQRWNLDTDVPCAPEDLPIVEAIITHLDMDGVTDFTRNLFVEANVFPEAMNFLAALFGRIVASLGRTKPWDRSVHDMLERCEKIGVMTAHALGCYQGHSETDAFLEVAVNALPLLTALMMQNVCGSNDVSRTAAEMATVIIGRVDEVARSRQKRGPAVSFDPSPSCGTPLLKPTSSSGSITSEPLLDLIDTGPPLTGALEPAPCLEGTGEFGLRSLFARAHSPPSAFAVSVPEYDSRGFEWDSPQTKSESRPASVGPLARCLLSTIDRHVVDQLGPFVQEHIMGIAKEMSDYGRSRPQYTGSFPQSMPGHRRASATDTGVFGWKSPVEAPYPWGEADDLIPPQQKLLITAEIDDPIEGERECSFPLQEPHAPLGEERQPSPTCAPDDEVNVAPVISPEVTSPELIQEEVETSLIVQNEEKPPNSAELTPPCESENEQPSSPEGVADAALAKACDLVSGDIGSESLAERVGWSSPVAEAVKADEKSDSNASPASAMEAEIAPAEDDTPEEEKAFSSFSAVYDFPTEVGADTDGAKSEVEESAGHGESAQGEVEANGVEEMEQMDVEEKENVREDNLAADTTACGLGGAGELSDEEEEEEEEVCRERNIEAPKRSQSDRRAKSRPKIGCLTLSMLHLSFAIIRLNTQASRSFAKPLLDAFVNLCFLTRWNSFLHNIVTQILAHLIESAAGGPNTLLEELLLNTRLIFFITRVIKRHRRISMESDINVRRAKRIKYRMGNRAHVFLLANALVERAASDEWVEERVFFSHSVELEIRRFMALINEPLSAPAPMTASTADTPSSPSSSMSRDDCLTSISDEEEEDIWALAPMRRQHPRLSDAHTLMSELEKTEEG